MVDIDIGLLLIDMFLFFLRTVITLDASRPKEEGSPANSIYAIT